MKTKQIKAALPNNWIQILSKNESKNILINKHL